MEQDPQFSVVQEARTSYLKTKLYPINTVNVFGWRCANADNDLEEIRNAGGG